MTAADSGGEGPILDQAEIDAILKRLRLTLDAVLELPEVRDALD